jgi:colanic acid biosynthesis glycosyl transferase WcaI
MALAERQPFTRFPAQIEPVTRPLSIQLWSYNYDPEPTGIGPVSTKWAAAMRDRGHTVKVVAAHPHYPSPDWGMKLTPYQEDRDGIPVVRLPLWIGRDSGLQRVRQEVSYAAALTAATPALGRPDVIVSVSPSFPALGPAMFYARARGIPWVLWLQDILPDGAASTGLVKAGRALQAARRFERAAYAAADRIIVISRTHEANLLSKGVPASKLVRIFNPATRTPEPGRAAPSTDAPRIFTMGNIGHSQGLDRVVHAFEACTHPAVRDARLVIAGHGVAVDDVRAEIRSDRVDLLGLVSDDELERELRRATIGLVSQRADIAV